MEQVIKEHSTKYQLLFKKYIDNQLILVVQENKFPATMSFSLVEPSSRLIWKTSYEPRTEIVSPASFSVVDQGSFETFMTVVYDAVERQSILTKSCEPIRLSGDWHNLGKQETDLVSQQITDQLKIVIRKDMGKAQILLQNPRELRSVVGEDNQINIADDDQSSNSKRVD